MEIEKQRNRVGGVQRWAVLGGGAAALIWGLKRRGIIGWPVALAGANYTVMGITGERNLFQLLGWKSPMDSSLSYGRGIKFRRAVTINRPVEQLYRFWRNLENLGRFMSNVESVTVLDNARSHWVVKAPGGRTVEWDAEITAERENELIGWRATGGPVDHAGSVRFEPAPGGRGAVVRVQMQYNPPGGKIGAGLAKLFGSEPEQMIREDLTRFKQLMETGEIPTTKGQPAGRRKEAIAPDRDQRPRHEHMRRGEPVEEGSEASFPASDAPSWMAGGGGGA
jgi:uncharacterized membrane protein